MIPGRGHDLPLITWALLRELQSLVIPHPSCSSFCLFDRKKEIDAAPKGQEHDLFILIDINAQTAHYFIILYFITEKKPLKCYWKYLNCKKQLHRYSAFGNSDLSSMPEPSITQ